MKQRDKIILGLLVLLALVLRTIKLADFPYGFHFDEAKVAWNALSIALTGKDDHGNVMPWYYNSFGDFRPTGIFYLMIPFILTLGRTVWAVRLPAAIFGTLTLIPIYLIAQELAPKKSKTNLGLWAAFFLAINPWHINVSRATSEVVISLFFTMLGLYFLIRVIKTNKWKPAVASIILTLTAYAFYHSIRVLAPLFVATTIGYFWLNYKREFEYRWSLMVLAVVTITTLVIMVSPQAQGRLSQVSIRSDFSITYETVKYPNEDGSNNVFVARTFHNKYSALLRRFGEEYFSYLGSDFLVGRTAKPVRYIVTNFGLITYIEYFLLLLGIAAAAVKKDIRLVWLWLLLAPIPAAVTMEDVPNLHRAMLMVPCIVLIEAWGMSLIWEMNNKLVRLGVLVLWGVHFVYYLHFYYNHGNFTASVYGRNGGMVELAAYVNQNKGNYDNVVLTNYSDNPYAWIAYFSKVSPQEFNGNYKKGEDGNYHYDNLIFTNEKCPTVSAFREHPNKKILVVDGEGCVETDNKSIKLKETILRKDGSPPFKLWERI